MPDTTLCPPPDGWLKIADPLVKSFEGYAKKLSDGNVEAYWDNLGKVWTIAWGLTGPGIAEGTIWSPAKAEQEFDSRLDVTANQVMEAIGDAPTTAGQMAAMVSFTYNEGAAAFAGSKIRAYHVAREYQQAYEDFFQWERAGSDPTALKERRTKEATLYIDSSP